MLAHALHRLATGAVTLLGVSLCTFALLQLTPADPLGERPATGPGLSPQQIESLRQLYHLDRPLHERYLRWLGDVLRADLGRSLYDRRPVAQKIAERLPLTLTLNTLALALAVGLAVPLGAAAALRPGSAWDLATSAAALALYSVPVFWAGVLLQWVLSARLGWFPLYGLEPVGWGGAGLERLAARAHHLVLPVLCLAYGGVAYLSRFVRNTLAESVRGEAVRAARARGASWWRVLSRHAFRQAAVPMLTLAGFVLPGLLAGSVIVETIFALPGLGRLFVDAVFQRDLPVVLALTLISGTATLLGILAADLAYGVLDPRASRGSPR